MYHLRGTVTYIGTQYFGWQIQTKGPKQTVQELLQKAFESVVSHPVKLYGSGRTDAGVHALAQTFHTTLEKSYTPGRLLLAINAHLPVMIKVAHLEPITHSFHAQKDATAKTYIYYLQTGPCQLPQWHERAWWIKKTINYSSMEKALQDLQGEHSFKPFCAADSSIKTFTRTIYKTELKKQYVFKHPTAWEKKYQIIQLSFTGSGFLKHMIRSIVGTLLDIGLEKKPLQHIQTILATQERSIVGPTAPAHGLWLESVRY